MLPPKAVGTGQMLQLYRGLDIQFEHALEQLGMQGEGRIRWPK